MVLPIWHTNTENIVLLRDKDDDSMGLGEHLVSLSSMNNEPSKILWLPLNNNLSHVHFVLMLSQ